MSEMTIKPPYGYMLVTDPDEKKENNWKYQNFIGEWETVSQYGKRSDVDTYAKPIPAPEGFELETDMNAKPKKGWIPFCMGIQCAPAKEDYIAFTVADTFNDLEYTWFKPITNTVDPGEGYRLLEVDERAIKGDEWLNDKGEWERLTLGLRIYGPGQHYRRKIEQSVTTVCASVDQEQINTRTAPSFDGWIYVRDAYFTVDGKGKEEDLHPLMLDRSKVHNDPLHKCHSVWRHGYMAAGGPLYRKVERTCPHCKGTGKVQE